MFVLALNWKQYCLSVVGYYTGRWSVTTEQAPDEGPSASESYNQAWKTQCYDLVWMKFMNR